MKIYYIKETGLFAGKNRIENSFIANTWKHKYTDDKYGFIEVTDEEAESFFTTAKGVIKVENGQLKSYDVVYSEAEILEQTRSKLITIRQSYLRQTSIKWGHDWDSCLQEIKDKRTLANIQIAEIEAIDKIEDLTIYNNNF